MSVKRILIAHQSTIPHYRVRFYQEVERLRPDWWDFTVVYDAEASKKKFFLALDHETFGFNIKHVRTHAFKIRNIDCTIFAETPKLSPYREAMKNCLAGTIEVETRKVVPIVDGPVILHANQRALQGGDGA